MEVSGHLHAPATLTPRKSPLVPTGQEAGWAPELVWTWWWRVSSTCPPQNPEHPACSPVPIPLYMSVIKIVRSNGKSHDNGYNIRGLWMQTQSY